MIEKDILDYLNSQLSVPVYTEIPANPPKTFVVFEKTSSGRENHIDSSTIAVQSYADSLLNAALLSATVKEKMLDIVTLASVARCKLNSEYNHTDTQMKKYRYQAVYDLTHY